MTTAIAAFVLLEQKKKSLFFQKNTQWMLFLDLLCNVYTHSI